MFCHPLFFGVFKHTLLDSEQIRGMSPCPNRAVRKDTNHKALQLLALDTSTYQATLYIRNFRSLNSKCRLPLLPTIVGARKLISAS